jgi:streptomycin 6-kinase
MYDVQDFEQRPFWAFFCVLFIYRNIISVFLLVPFRLFLHYFYMAMHSYIEKWDLHDPDVMPETRTSKLCRVVQGVNGEKAVLKFLKPLGIADEANGARILDYYNGVGAVRVIRYDEGAHLLEYADGPQYDDLGRHKYYADGKTLAQALDLGLSGKSADFSGVAGDNGAVRIAADIVQKLHESKRFKKFPEGLTPLESRFEELFTRAAIEEKEGRINSIFAEAVTLATYLLATQRDEDVLPLHGDLHHSNIVHSDSRGEWLAIDPKGLFGDKAYELAPFFINPMGRGEIMNVPGREMCLASIFSEALGYDRNRIIGFGAAQAALSASWSLADGRFARAEEAIIVAEKLMSQVPRAFLREGVDAAHEFSFTPEGTAPFTPEPAPV